MYQCLAGKITNLMLKEGIGECCYREIYVYGFECFLSTLFQLAITLILGKLTGLTWQVIAFTVPYILLRISSGGAHRKTHLQCALTYQSLMLAGICGLHWVGSLLYGTWVVNMILLYSTLVVFAFSPVESVNKPLEPGLKHKLKVKSMATIAVEDAAIWISLFFAGRNSIITSATAGVFVQASLLLPVFNKERA